jgi:hypothetical protein
VCSLPGFLALHKDAIVGLWLERALQGYAPDASRFFLQDQDCFRNPVGAALRESLPVLYAALIGEHACAGIEPKLDTVIRMRAVQNFSASQAVAFIFSLKEIVRREMKAGHVTDPDGSALAELDARIDGMALLAFDLFTQCREQISQITANEAGRRTFVSDRISRSRGGNDKG